MAAKRKTKRATQPKPRTVPIIEAIGGAMSEIEDLASEMREQADSMEAYFSSTNKYQMICDAAELLESVDDPLNDEHAVVAYLTVVIQDPTPRKRGYSRADRLSFATATLMDVRDVLDRAELPPDHEEIANGLRDELDNIDSELQGVEFPGMFG